jgi:hypothetical protein
VRISGLNVVTGMAAENSPVNSERRSAFEKGASGNLAGRPQAVRNGRPYC